MSELGFIEHGHSPMGSKGASASSVYQHHLACGPLPSSKPAWLKESICSITSLWSQFSAILFHLWGCLQLHRIAPNIGEESPFYRVIRLTIFLSYLLILPWYLPGLGYADIFGPIILPTTSDCLHVKPSFISGAGAVHWAGVMVTTGAKWTVQEEVTQWEVSLCVYGITVLFTYPQISSQDTCI